MNKDEIAGLVERWAEHGSATGKTLLEIAVSARMPEDKINQWCQALQFCSTMADAQHNALTTLSAENEALRHDVQRQMAIAIEHVNESATLSARVETLEAEVQAAAKAERDRLRNLPGDVVETAWDCLPGWVDVSDTEIKLIAAALADALESKP